MFSVIGTESDDLGTESECVQMVRKRKSYKKTQIKKPNKAQAVMASSLNLNLRDGHVVKAEIVASVKGLKNLVVVIDVSGSMTQHFPTLREVLKRLHRMGVTTIVFSSDAQVVDGDADKSDAELEAVRFGGGTAYVGALRLLSEAIVAGSEVFFVTDGQPNDWMLRHDIDSEGEPSEIIEAYRAAGPPELEHIHCVLGEHGSLKPVALGEYFGRSPAFLLLSAMALNSDVKVIASSTDALLAVITSARHSIIGVVPLYPPAESASHSVLCGLYCASLFAEQNEAKQPLLEDESEMSVALPCAASMLALITELAWNRHLSASDAADAFRRLGEAMQRHAPSSVEAQEFVRSVKVADEAFINKRVEQLGGVSHLSAFAAMARVVLTGAGAGDDGPKSVAQAFPKLLEASQSAALNAPNKLVRERLRLLRKLRRMKTNASMLLTRAMQGDLGHALSVVNDSLGGLAVSLHPTLCKALEMDDEDLMNAVVGDPTLAALCLHGYATISASAFAGDISASLPDNQCLLVCEVDGKPLKPSLAAKATSLVVNVLLSGITSALGPLSLLNAQSCDGWDEEKDSVTLRQAVSSYLHYSLDKSDFMLALSAAREDERLMVAHGGVPNWPLLLSTGGRGVFPDIAEDPRFLAPAVAYMLSRKENEVAAHGGKQELDTSVLDLLKTYAEEHITLVLDDAAAITTAEELKAVLDDGQTALRLSLDVGSHDSEDLFKSIVNAVQKHQSFAPRPGLCSRLPNDFDPEANPTATTMAALIVHLCGGTDKRPSARQTTGEDLGLRLTAPDTMVIEKPTRALLSKVMADRLVPSEQQQLDQVLADPSSPMWEMLFVLGEHDAMWASLKRQSDDVVAALDPTMLLRACTDEVIANRLMQLHWTTLDQPALLSKPMLCTAYVNAIEEAKSPENLPESMIVAAGAPACMLRGLDETVQVRLRLIAGHFKDLVEHPALAKTLELMMCDEGQRAYVDSLKGFLSLPDRPLFALKLAEEFLCFEEGKLLVHEIAENFRSTEECKYDYQQPSLAPELASHCQMLGLKADIPSCSLYVVAIPEQTKIAVYAMSDLVTRKHQGERWTYRWQKKNPDALFAEVRGLLVDTLDYPRSAKYASAARPTLLETCQSLTEMGFGDRAKALYVLCTYTWWDVRLQFDESVQWPAGV
jgi:hypothetical protein